MVIFHSYVSLPEGNLRPSSTPKHPKLQILKHSETWTVNRTVKLNIPLLGWVRWVRWVRMKVVC